jgi:xanthine dehydrogenase molybdenum-binding subunit
MGTIAQIAAEVLGITYEDVHVFTGDTRTTMFDHGHHASGGLYQMGNATILAATAARKQLLERGAKKLAVRPDELDVKNRRIFVKADPLKALPLSEITKEAMYNLQGEDSDISAKGSFSPTKNPAPCVAVFAEVEVDIESGEVKLLKVLYVNDSGTAINPATLEGQLEGAIAQSIGYALIENYVVNEKTGMLESDNYNTYKIPSALDMPETEVVLYEEQPDPSGPFGAKGAAQGAMIAVTPAIANAIYDAIGVCVTDMPITPEKILKALRQK